MAPTRDDLVDVRLMTGVPQDRIGRRVEDPVERQRQFDRAEVRAEVATVLRDGLDDEVADLTGERI